MTLARVFYILGIILMVWAVISGLNMKYSVVNGDSFFDSSYSFKLGLFIVGLVLIFIGRKSGSAKS